MAPSPCFSRLAGFPHLQVVTIYTVTDFTQLHVRMPAQTHICTHGPAYAHTSP